MEILFEQNKAIIPNSCCFDLVHTFECGQCFRWNINPDGSYTGIVGGKVLTVSQAGSTITLSPCTPQDYADLWRDYFDLDRDYTEVQAQLSCDSVLKTAIAYGSGIRILKQDPWETLISFIVSANNNIPRIKGIIERLCSNFGEPIQHGTKLLYAFPTPERLSDLTEEDLSVIRAGYRGAYILDAAKKVASGELDLDALTKADPQQARSMLMGIKGVGEKVAGCILLFGLGHLDAVPVDVWIKRTIQAFYFGGQDMKHADIAAFCGERFGSLGGFAQQYLFYYARETKVI